MALSVGSRLGPYEILGALGAGGMGEVYRATDTKLKRQVAIKVLPASLAPDADRLARFQREAEVLAALNHPNIAAIYGLEDTDGSKALVMELVEGPTLADLIAGGHPSSAAESPGSRSRDLVAGTSRGGGAPRGLKTDEALPIAKQIAEALEAAHEQGIIHRDLKPANVKIRPDGTVKVLDFGLAKALEPTGAMSPNVSQSPTITTPAMTQAGMILGTAAYMSPEQAKGGTVDKRSDVWAFGAVLYEMLSGQRAFAGSDVSEVLASVLAREPDWTLLPRNVSPVLGTYLRRCLQKDPRQRVQAIGDVRLALEGAFESVGLHPGDVAARPSADGPRWRRALVPTLTLLVGGLVAGAGVWLATRPSPPRVSRTTITPPDSARLTITSVSRDLAIAPDGTRLVYVGVNDTQLIVRALDQFEPTTLTDVGAPSHPIFSPDGQWIAFFDGNTALKKVATTGGPVVTVGPVPGGSPRGASWGPDDTIVFASNAPATGLLLVGAAGGNPEVLTTPDPVQDEVDHLWPEVLPDGQAVLFTTIVQGGIDQAQIGVLDLRTGARRVLVRGGSHAQYVAPGYLVYGLANTLWAVAFDLARLEVVGTPVPVVEGVVMAYQGATDASVAADGTLVYVPWQAESQRTLVWVDRQGREEPLVAAPQAYSSPRLSPDGTKLAVSVGEEREGDDIWIWDLARETPTRLTFAGSGGVVWTPDGRRLVWVSGTRVYGQAADGTGAPELLFEGEGGAPIPSSVTPDGTRVVLRLDAQGTGVDVALLALEHDRTLMGSTPDEPAAPPRITPLLQTAASERNAEISPDGRWVAHESDESGRSEIYVRPFPAVDAGRWQVSSAGGRKPVWAGNGREIFYRALDGALLGAHVDVESDASFRVAVPVRLVEGRYVMGGPFGGRQYDVSPDGQRFLMVKEVGATGERASPRSIIVVQSWVEELKRLVPVE
jgi:serine/threonine-protein kinase